MRKIKRGDAVIVITGKDKGKHGSVVSVVGETHVVVEHINVAKKHLKGDPNKGVASGIVEKEMPMAISNVAIFNRATKKPDRVGFKLLSDGKKIRIFKSTREAVDG